MKNLDDFFRDWEGSAFGYGYGTGESHTIPALRRFLELCNEGVFRTAYDYRKLEAALTPPVVWLLINNLCKDNILEYGTSPRGAWLTGRGKRLKEYMLAHTDEALIEIACDRGEDYIRCYPDACNCGPNGYEPGKTCDNPFWKD